MAIALLEFQSIAAGIESGDAVVKRAKVEVLHAGTVQPGHYLLLLTGSVGELEEAIDAADLIGFEFVTDRVFLPDPHPQLRAALSGTRSPGGGEALGIIETSTVAASLVAADADLKGAVVTLREIFLADGLGGKGYLLFGGPVVEVEAAVEVACERAGNRVIASRVIAQLHAEMEHNLAADGRFSARVRGS